MRKLTLETSFYFRFRSIGAELNQFTVVNKILKRFCPLKYCFHSIAFNFDHPDTNLVSSDSTAHLVNYLH